MANIQLLLLLHRSRLCLIRLVSRATHGGYLLPPSLKIPYLTLPLHRWLGADPSSLDPSPCKPNPSPNGFDWFEYSTGGCNNSTGQCKFDAVNYSARDAVLPAFEEAYVVVRLQLGPTDRELMFLSYFDKIGGASAVGVRTALEGGKACERAFETLKNLVNKHDLPISFKMENPCRKVEAAPVPEKEGQKVLRFDPRPGLAHGFKA
jgi:hypothetical protein